MDYFFAENGLVAYKQAQVIAIQSLKTWLGEDKLKELINFALHYIADLDIPIKRGTFIEFRNGMLNICPIGRNCSQAERDEFGRYDDKTGVRSDSPLWPCSHDTLLPAGLDTDRHYLLQMLHRQHFADPESSAELAAS